MKIKTKPADIWKEYQTGIEYNSDIGLYDTVKTNENFYVGKQWEGVNAPDLDKPVFNVLKRVCSMFIAQIVSDDVSVRIDPYVNIGNDENTMRILTKEISRALEYSKAKSRSRDMLRNACVDGDGCFYIYFNNDAETGQIAKGLIDIENIDNTNIIFGNPHIDEVQRQPYLIIVQRRTIDSVKDEAKQNGVSKDDIDSIKCDEESNYMNENYNDNLVTVLIKLWKDKGTVWCSKTTQDVTIKKAWNTKYKLFPVAYMNWEKIKNSYHGQSAVSGLIPNQIFINKTFAMGMDYVKKLAFPKLIYDANMFPNGFDNTIGKAIPVEGNVTDSITSAFRMPDMSSQVMELVEKTMTYTKEYLGASDASLGNVKADNATAIVALQKASNAPLELQKHTFYQFVEDYIRVFIDIMRVDYGLREVKMAENDERTPMLQDGTELPRTEYFNFSVLDDYVLNLEVNIGASAYWSEIMQIQTADALYSNGLYADPVTYINSIPDSYIKNKQQIIDDLKMVQQQQMAQMQQQQMMPEQVQMEAPQNTEPIADTLTTPEALDYETATQAMKTQGIPLQNS